MSYTNKIIFSCLIFACCISFVVIPALAFTANSLDITIDKNGDAIATFRYTLEGIIENTIPQSMLEDELKKGLTTSTEPPELISMDRSSAVLRMKKFAEISDVPTGTGYLTVSMDFKLAEIALQNSPLSSIVSADFSPETVTLTFPDSYKREFSNVDALPAIFHTVVDPSKTPRTTAEPGTAATGAMNVTSSPLNVKVYLDSGYIGEAPSLFPEIEAGTHMVEFRKEGFESASKNVIIVEGTTTNVMVVLRYIPPVTPAETSSSGLFWPVLIIALIAIAGGGYYFWSQKKKKAWGMEEDTETEDTSIQHPAGESKPLKDTAASDPSVRDTIIKVTMLKDIPDKEKGNSGRKDKQE